MVNHLFGFVDSFFVNDGRVTEEADRSEVHWETILLQQVVHACILE